MAYHLLGAICQHFSMANKAQQGTKGHGAFVKSGGLSSGQRQFPNENLMVEYSLPEIGVGIKAIARPLKPGML